ncbi:MAG TPA: radical SAM protein, partial [Blastocatellia bacterium]|nr:radical SAM protein [Blastocatellia bacterium]
KSVELESVEHSLKLDEKIITQEVQHDLEKLGIAKTAREEKMRAQRERVRKEQENARMAKLYREQILKEPAEPAAPLVQIKVNRANPSEEITPAGFGD